MTPPTTINSPLKMTDTVMEEVRRMKVALLEKFNYDLEAMIKDARERQGKSGHEVVDMSKGKGV